MASEQEEQEGGVFDSLAEEMDKAAEAHPHDIDKQIEMALECPCVEDMMQGPCKDSFVDSFSCFMKSTHSEVKGYDCIEHFEKFQKCLEKHPEHTEQFFSGGDDA
ncbi:hypothetical protein M9434_004169 [Picochlorum sp. BPE23]|nr:hypothetical protein M9434_004169 [Picochlorum sp. BPE23]